MPGFAAILQTALGLTLRSWLALVIVLLLRGGLAVAGLLPFILVFMVAVRSFLAAPVDPATGLGSPGLWWAAVRVEPLVWAGVAGVLSALFLVRFVLLALLEGGLWGGMAAALRAGRGMRLGELLSHGLRLFDRAVIFRLLADLFSLVLLTALLGLPLVWLWLEGSREPDALFLPQRLAAFWLGGLALWALGETLLFFAHLSVMSAAAVQDAPPATALRDGLRFLRDHCSKLLVMGAFFGVVASLWAVLRLSGSLWFTRLAMLENSGRLLQVGANAWDLTFGILSLLLWLAFIAVVLQLYLRSLPDRRPEAEQGR